MVTILSYLKKINPLETEKSVYNEAIHAGASEFLYSISPNKNAFELATSEQGFVYHRLKIETTDSLQKNCGYDLPMVFAEEPKPKKKEERKRKDKKLIYPTIFDFCKNGGNLRQAVFTALKTMIKSWIYICSWIEGKYRCFLSNAKGTPAYCKKYYWRIHDFCKQCDSFYKHKYFLTLTMSQREYGTDLQRAWSVIQNKLSNFLKKWQEKYQGDYACALEAHKSGFPHIHIVFYTNAGIVDPKEQFDKFKRAVCLCSGEMFDFVKKFWTLGISVLKVNYRKNTCDYLAKYISKAEDADLRNYTLQSLKDDSILKEVMTLLLPMVFGIRQFKISQGRFNKKESADSVRQNEFSESATKKDTSPEVKDFVLKGAELEEIRTLLKTLCTKLLPSCLKSVYSKTGLDFQKAKPITPESVENLPIHRNIRFAESGCRLSCKGCILSKVLQFVISGEDKVFQNARNWKLIASMSAWHYERIDDKSAGLSGESLSETKKLFKIKNANRDNFFLKKNPKGFYKNIVTQIHNLLCKEISQEEIKDFLTAAYTVNPMLARFVLPKKWASLIEFYNCLQGEEIKKLSPEEVSFIKECCNFMILDFTNSANGIILEE